MFISVLVTLSFFHLATFAQTKPNIVVLFSDDAGYADFGFQGSKTFPTPNLDKLASEGVVFKQAYVTAAVCGPSRAGLLTGMYPQRYGYEENNVPGYMSPSGLESPYMGLPLNIKTIADYLKPLGYKSAIMGKWHMGELESYHPLNRGFDEFYGFRGGGRSYFAMNQKELFQKKDNKLEHGYDDFEEPVIYLTDELAVEACSFIERNQENPFFLFLSFNAVHTPMEATQADLEKIKGLTGQRKTLAAMTLALDRACGNVLDKLKELGLDENTLVVFANDNGGPTDASSACNYPLSGCKANFLEGGIRVPCIMKMPGKLKANSVYQPVISTLDFLPTFVELAGGEANKIEVLDGVDLFPYLTGKNNNTPNEKLFWKNEMEGAVRDGDWKLLRFPDRPAELYNLAEDISENHDLASQYPEKVLEMYKLLFQWEGGLERPLWQLQRKYEVAAMKRMDDYRVQKPD